MTIDKLTWIMTFILVLFQQSLLDEKLAHGEKQTWLSASGEFRNFKKANELMLLIVKQFLVKQAQLLFKMSRVTVNRHK